MSHFLHETVRSARAKYHAAYDIAEYATQRYSAAKRQLTPRAGLSSLSSTLKPPALKRAQIASSS
ncbi:MULTISPECIES: hypothetical protein [unclassified Corynebacterium]|uniref:hypothetical protein n=1 Tax=unclassified Corynebacterium TaxID=2624378 RepID=UPI0034CE94CB